MGHKIYVHNANETWTESKTLKETKGRLYYEIANKRALMTRRLICDDPLPFARNNANAVSKGHSHSSSVVAHFMQ